MRFINDFIGSDSGFNSLGHRCKERQDLDFENYILFTGCSHTLGEGLEIEQTFPFLTGKLLNLDYYNLGLSGSGIDVLLHNLVVWFNSTPKKPKLLVVQYPDYTRFSSVIDTTNNIIPRGNWDKTTQKFIVDGIDNGLFTARKRMAINQIQSFNVPTITFTHGNTEPYEQDSLRMRHLDYANDNVHSGIISHKEFASILADIALDKY